MQKSYIKTLVYLALVFPIVFLIASGIGAYYINPLEIPAVLWNHGEAYEILTLIRFPRVVLTSLVGASYGAAGVAMQAYFRNPLASPTLIGVGSGASLGASLWIVLLSNHVSFFYGLPISAFLGAFFVVLIVCKMGLVGGGLSSISILLAGVAVNAFVGAILGFLTYISNDEQLRTVTFWSMGDLGRANWESIMYSLPIFVIGLMMILPMGKSLNILSLGESEAYHLGVNIKRSRNLIIIGTSLLISTSVCLSGGIGFVGLVIPHALRMWKGPDHRWLLPGSCLLGASFLLIADLVSRLVVLPAVLPIGIVTALIGGPFFFYLFMKLRKQLVYAV